MWGIAEDWLGAQPSFEEILERLREVRRLPEAADFQAFKCQQLELFTNVIRPQQELLHLPDGRTLLLSISPHPFGGLTFVYEDVSDRLALERSCKTLTKVRRATLDHLFEGIAVYGSDSRLKLHNPAYLALWDLSEDDVAGDRISARSSRRPALCSMTEAIGVHERRELSRRSPLTRWRAGRFIETTDRFYTRQRFRCLTATYW